MSTQPTAVETEVAPFKFGDVVRHGNAQPAEGLDPLGNDIDNVCLLAEMLVEQQVKLVESRPRNLPVMLLVHVAKRHRVGQQLVEVVDALFANFLAKRDRHRDDVPEGLDLVSLLVDDWRGAIAGRAGVFGSGSHFGVTPDGVMMDAMGRPTSISNANCFSEFTQNLPPQEKQRIIHQYYMPYRTKIETLIQNLIDQGKQVLHISCHSFTPVFNGISRNGEICLLYDPSRHGEKEVAREWRGLLNQHNIYKVRMNYPYRGVSDGFTTTLRKKHPEKNYLGFELEVNQTLVGDKTSLKKLMTVLSESLGELLQLL